MAPTVACSALALGYGPAAKLVVLAHALRRRGLRTVFVGAGCSHELAARSDAFDAAVCAPPDSDEARAVLGGAAALLTLMDRPFARAAHALGTPVVAVDSLFWMRHRILETFSRAHRYYVQDFVGVRERARETLPAPTVVGPIVAPMEPVAPRAGGPVVVNLGACEAAPGCDDDDAAAYGDFVVRGVVASGVLDGLDAPPLLMAGSGCIGRLRGHPLAARFELVSVAHDEAVAILRDAGLVLTAPGLTATLECFQLAVPALFLPPQNYSQWWNLKKLRPLDLAPGSFHWSDLLAADTVAERMSEKSRAPLVRAAIREILGRGDAVGRFAAGLAEARRRDLALLRRRQRAFFDSLGPNGVDVIVNELVALCAGERRREVIAT